MKKSSPIRKQSNPAPPRLRGWKRWAFPLAAMVLIPGLFFVLLEAGLRVANYGFPTDFLIKRKVGNATVYTDNRQYGWRFFPPHVARRPADIVLPETKAPNTFRVFVLGESAAMGDPDPAYGMIRMLETMLSERFPSVKFEVVNAAMTGISSHVIRDIANQCAKFQPDCFVVYMGNNEAIGPYGPGTVFASFSRNLAITRLSIAVRSLKTSQLIEGLIRSRSKAEEGGGWGGLRVFMKSQLHSSDGRVALLAEHFEDNLKAICEAGRKAGAKLVLCSVGSNLADCSPFASLNSPSLSLEQKNAFDARWQTATKLQGGGNVEGALKAFEEAEAIDPTHAELHFQKATLRAALRGHQDARESFVRARDVDALTFRTTSELNKRAQQLAATFPASDAVFADVVKTLAEDSSAKGLGTGHFVDHVHFNFHGNYVVAREMFNAVSRFVPGGAQNGTNTAGLSEEECRARLAFTRWNEMRIAEYMMKRFEIPPFNSKSDAAQRLNEFKTKIAQLQDAASRGSMEEAVAIHRKALEGKKNDADLLRSLGILHSELGQNAEELKCHQAMYELFPYDNDRKAFLAEAYARSGNNAEGEKLAREALEVDPAHIVARLALATALDNKGATDSAMTEYKEVLRLRPDMVEVKQRIERLLARANQSFGGGPQMGSVAPASPQESRKHLQLGETFLQQERFDDAVKQFQIAVRLEPSLVEAHLGLAGALVRQGRPEEAIAQCKEALRIHPAHAELHNSLGALLTELGRLAEGRTYLEQALKIDPENSDARLNMGLNMMHDKRFTEAAENFELFLKKNPEAGNVHMQLGMLYENAANWEKAKKAYAGALRAEPENEQYQACLAWILATSPQDDVRNGEEAVRLAKASCRGPKQQAYLLDTLAAALAEAGNYTEAVKVGENALTLARAENDPQAADIDKRVALYKSNKPFRLAAVPQDAATR